MLRKRKLNLDLAARLQREPRAEMEPGEGQTTVEARKAHYDDYFGHALGALLW